MCLIYNIKQYKTHVMSSNTININSEWNLVNEVKSKYKCGFVFLAYPRFFLPAIDKLLDLSNKLSK